MRARGQGRASKGKLGQARASLGKHEQAWASKGKLAQERASKQGQLRAAGLRNRQKVGISAKKEAFQPILTARCRQDGQVGQARASKAQAVGLFPERPGTSRNSYCSIASSLMSSVFAIFAVVLAINITVASASATSPVFHSQIFRNAFDSARRSVQTGAILALSRQRCTILPGGGRRQSRYGYPSRNANCPARTGATPLRIGFGLGLPIIDDILEPIEMLWEFYMARDEIQEQMIANAGKILRKNSVRTLGFTGGAVIGAEVLARLGFIGDRGEGLAQYVKENEKLRNRIKKIDDRLDEEVPGVVARTCRSCFRKYRDLPERLKFTIAFSTGATLQQTLINAAVSTIKLSVGTFVVLETLSFTGIIGEPGESIVEWVDDHDDEIRDRFGKRWGNKAKRFRQNCRKYLSFDGVVELYEAAVDEEKVATFGLGLGMVAGSLV